VNLLLMLAHSIAEYDDVRMFSDAGYDVFSIGAYADPVHPGDDKRPPLPDAPRHPELAALVPDQMRAKEYLPDDLIDWADVIICHHYLREWVMPQWGRIKHKRVVWRTCGQSDFALEDEMKRLRREGLVIVRYSPAEGWFFRESGHWAGCDATIRFGKYPTDYRPWVGDGIWVGNVTQNMAGRGEWVGRSYWERATADLPTRMAGPGSEQMGGCGTLPYEELLRYLRRTRVYLYTGTHPAPYTLGLIEALMSGTPVVSIGRHDWMGPDALFEADKIAPIAALSPEDAARHLRGLLGDEALARYVGQEGRDRALELFDVATVTEDWVRLLGGVPSPDTAVGMLA